MPTNSLSFGGLEYCLTAPRPPSFPLDSLFLLHRFPHCDPQAKAVIASARHNNSRKTKNKRRSTPRLLTDPVTGGVVYVAAATLSDLTAAARKRRPPWPHAAQRFLVTVPSPAQRAVVYDRAAAALAALEVRVLPRYGNRPWQCAVTIREETAAAPYFCWNARGRLELAAWPHVVEKMPVPPRFPGYYAGGGPRAGRPTAAAAAAAKKTKAVTTAVVVTGDEGAAAAVNEEAAEAPSAAKDEEVVESDEELEEEEEVLSDELLEMRDLQERRASGLSELAWNERWRVPLPSIQYRWISPLRQSFASRKAAWEHAVQLCRQEIVVDKALTGYGANGQPLKLMPPARKTALTAGKLRFARDGLWVVGQEEAWGRKRLAAARDAYGTGAAGAPEKEPFDEIGATASAPAVQGIAPGCAVGEARSPHSEPIKKSRRLTGLTYFVQCNRREHREKRLRQQQHETCEPRSAAAVVTPSKTTDFASPSPAPPESPSAFAAPPPVPVVPAAPDTPAPSKALSFTLRDAADELRAVWKSLPDGEKLFWTEGAKKEQREMDAKHPLTLAPPTEHLNGMVTPSLDLTIVDCDRKASAELVDISRHGCDCSLLPIGGSVVSTSPPPFETASDAPASGRLDLKGKFPPVSKFSATAAAPVVKSPNTLPRPAKTTPFDAFLARKDTAFTQSRKWCLNDEQIKMCYEAGVAHYDQIMRTVTARDLSRELQDGFDLLRERGKGRWDMNLPEWESSDYSFINSTLKSPWMPIVKEILGKDVVLIHKGMFLSMPGSNKQVYHQDGPHLTTQYQKPCHAINVFIPLVDLTAENGPTEFCLGSHILGHEELNEDFVEVPTVAAGTPIIFDYRLGHRGLGNSSEACRPIVYCTYAASADGKEFRDSVNFSRKRYHRIGELVEKGLTREERAEKRKRSIEDQLLADEAAAFSDALAESSELTLNAAVNSAEIAPAKRRKERLESLPQGPPSEAAPKSAVDDN